MLISAPLASASSPIAEKSFSSMPERPLVDDLEQRAVGATRDRAVGTTIEAPIVTRR